ncbi:MAG: MFS transporter [Candidatus Micrarchaeota archaeon]|nr:MFS transporter [Candidatus Micrarchaeota archaeon]
MKKPKWLNRTVLGAGLASFFSDLSHEAVTALLPSFMVVLGAPAYALGIIEGASDALSSFAKLFSGYYSDKLGRRKEFASLGYAATAIFPAIIAVASNWHSVLFGRAFGWLGRGMRGPPRDAILAKSVARRDLGKAFGFHRAGDTLGAIAGPVAAFAILGTGAFAIREIFWLALMPGFLALAAFWLLVKEKRPASFGAKKPFLASISALPPAFKSFLGAVLVFGMADFSHTLLIAFAVAALSPSLGFAGATTAGVALYTIRNVSYAACCYPFGALGDRFGRKRMLAAGYLLAVLTFVGFMLSPPDLLVYAALFAMAGAFIAAEDTLEGAVAGELVAEKRRGLGFGALAAANGMGDFVSSVAVGALWSAFGFSAGFAFCAALGALGALMLMYTGGK